MNATSPAPPARLPAFLQDMLQVAAQRVLELDPDARTALAGLEGKLFRVRLVNPDIELFVSPGPDGLVFSAEPDGDVSTTLKGSPFDLFSLSLAGTETGLPPGHVEISGDIDAGRQLADILGRLDPDWEEPLSLMVGDVAAHEMGRMMRGGLAWVRDVGRRMAENAARYATDETGDVVSKSEIAEFCSEVNRLRDDVERLEARMRRPGKAG